jgi:hypothetical protein
VPVTITEGHYIYGTYSIQLLDIQVLDNGFTLVISPTLARTFGDITQTQL